MNADDVADLAMAMLIDRLRNIRTGNRFLLAGKWVDGPFPLARSLYGKTLGIVGLGAIGRAVARRAEAHRLRIKWTGPHPKADTPHEYVPDLEQLARECDVLLVSCAGGPATRHLINAPVLAALGPEGILINVARGAIVDTEALIRALQSGQIAAGAGAGAADPSSRIRDERNAGPHGGDGHQEPDRPFRWPAAAAPRRLTGAVSVSARASPSGRLRSPTHTARASARALPRGR